jgi:hypothetical protein
MLHEMCIKCGFTRQVQRSGDLPRQTVAWVTLSLALYYSKKYCSGHVPALQCCAKYGIDHRDEATELRPPLQRDEGQLKRIVCFIGLPVNEVFTPCLP